MSRLARTFAGLRRRGARALIPYFTAGDPSLAAARPLALRAARRGGGAGGRPRPDPPGRPPLAPGAHAADRAEEPRLHLLRLADGSDGRPHHAPARITREPPTPPGGDAQAGIFGAGGAP